MSLGAESQFIFSSRHFPSSCKVRNLYNCQSHWRIDLEEHIRSRINQSIATQCSMLTQCRTFWPHGPLSTTYKTLYLPHCVAPARSLLGSLVIYASVVAQSGPSMKAVALGVEEEKYSSVTAFVRLCLQALESDGEENVTKKRKFTFMKVRR